MAKFVSAQFVNTDVGVKIRAVGDDGRVYWLENNPRVGDWLEYVKNGGVVTAAVPLPTPPTPTEKDKAVADGLQAALGDPVRALGMLAFKEINKLRVKTGDAAYTPVQFWTAYQNEVGSQ